MALKKDIELENGIIVGYHRISAISTYVNNSIVISVASYINEEKRNEEKIEKTDEEYSRDINNIVTTLTEIAEYSEDFDVKTAYEYLKTLDKFKDAEDV